MAVTFTRTKQASKHNNLLVYGRSGVGKTTLIATAKKPLIISTESGLLSIADYDIPVIEIKDLDDFKEAYKFCKQKKILKKYDLIALDSISDIAETVLSHLKENVKDPRQAYGQLADSIGKLIRKFRDLDTSTYFIAKAEVYENAAGMQALRPSMPGKKLTNDIDYFFDVVLCLEINTDDEDKPYRYLRTQLTSTVNAKDRSNKLNAIEKPNLAYVMKKLKK